MIHVVFSLVSEAALPSSGVAGNYFMYRGCFCSVPWIGRLASNTGVSLKKPETLSLKKLHSYFSFNKSPVFLNQFSTLLHGSKRNLIRITNPVKDSVLKYIKYANNWFTSRIKNFHWGRNSRREYIWHNPPYRTSRRGKMHSFFKKKTQTKQTTKRLLHKRRPSN